MLDEFLQGSWTMILMILAIFAAAGVLWTTVFFAACVVASRTDAAQREAMHRTEAVEAPTIPLRESLE